MRNLFRYFALRHLRLRPARTALTTLGVSFGVALFVAIDLINRSTTGSFRENVEAVSGKTQLSVSAGDAGFDEGVLETVRLFPGVRHAVPMVENSAYFAGDREARQSLRVLGVDLLKEQAVRTYKTADEQVVDDPLVFLNQPDSIIITHAFARANRLKMDSTFELATARGRRKFTVRGLLSPEGPAKAFGGSIALMDIDGARMTFGKENKLDRIDIVPAAGVAVNVLAEALRTKLGAAFQVERPSAQGESLERMVATFQRMMSFFSSLALVVGLFLVANSVSIAVAERRKEIGTLRAVGATRISILGMFLSEAVATGFAGSLLGVALGRFLAGGLVDLVTRSMSSQFLTQIRVSRLLFGTDDWIRGTLLGTAAALLAAAWPAWKSMAIQPLEAMKRYEGASESGEGWLSRYGGWVGLAIALYLVAFGQAGFAGRFPLLENLNQIVSMVGAALLGPPLVLGFLRQLQRPYSKVVGTVGRLSIDNLLRSPRRTASNVTSLMVGLILVILIAAINLSFRRTIGDWLEQVIQAPALITAQGKLISFENQPMHEDLARDILAVDGIDRTFDPPIGAMRFLHLKFRGQTISMKAYDPPPPSFGYRLIAAVEGGSAQELGSALFQTEEDRVLISETLGRKFGLRTGEMLRLATPSGEREFRIVGQMTDFSSPVGVIYLNRRVYRKHWKDPLVSLFSVRFRPGVSAEDFRSRFDRAVGAEKNLMVVLQAEFKQELMRSIDQSFAYTRAIEFCALMVGLLGLMNTLLISVLERTRELGMLRAVGMTRMQLASMILQESFLQGILGGAVAVILGSAMAYLWITSSLEKVLGWLIAFHFPLSSIGVTLGVGVTVALLAGFWPARRAANLEIREALDYE
jgi:putative ABC transport system permease protein